MYTTSAFFLAAVPLLSLSQSASANFLYPRQKHVPISSALPTVPSFTQRSVNYGAYSSVYPSGYTLPSGPGKASATPTATADDSRSTDIGNFRGPPAEVSQMDYLQNMCAPERPARGRAYATLDLNYPCNEVLNITYTCIYNLTAEEQPSNGTDGALIESGPEAQQQCLCPGGVGEAIWENVEACAACLSEAESSVS